MLTTLAVALGGAIGSVARYWLNLAVTARTGEQMPWGTIAINVSGSFVIGLFSAMTGPGGRLDWPVEARLFVVVGLCGGYTTFSSFSLQTLALFEAGHPLRAIVNVVLSVTLCLLAVWLGHSAIPGAARGADLIASPGACEAGATGRAARQARREAMTGAAFRTGYGERRR